MVNLYRSVSSRLVMIMAKKAPAIAGQVNEKRPMVRQAQKNLEVTPSPSSSCLKPEGLRQVF
jgi:hypothetical protein